MMHLSVQVFDNPGAAIAGGFDYNTWETPPKGLVLDKAIVVRKGTISGADTVDLILIDEDGKHYVAMITAALLKALLI